MISFSIDNIKNLQIMQPISEEQGANAAVALLLRQEYSDISVLLVKRTESSHDPWSGQMAFPGGKQDSGDKTLKNTVIREAREEIGINLEKSTFLGVLEAAQSIPRPELKILPFVIVLKGNPAIVLNERELQRVYWISLAELARSRTTYTFSFGEFPAYVVGDLIIWGLTYRILENVVQSLEHSHEFSTSDTSP